MAHLEQAGMPGWLRMPATTVRADSRKLTTFSFMAQSKSFFGLRRGSTKSLTFQVFNGKQVTKDRVESVKNPRTPAQMDQRMIMKTVGAAYSAMREIVDHSFQGYSYGMQNMSHFLSVNAEKLRSWMNNPAKDPMFVNYGQNYLVANAWRISEGTASHILVAPTAAESTGALAITLSDDVTGDFTASKFFEMLGISVGELCTICIMYADYNYDAHFAFIRFTALQAGDVALTAENYSTYIKVETNKNGMAVALDATSGKGGFVCSWSGSEFVDQGNVMMATIHSAKVDGVWTRSTENFEPEDSFGGGLYDDAIATYPVGEAKILNGGNF
jgi:hypothetical protein